MKDQRIKNHPLYPKYAQMRIRERELLHEQEELSEECKNNSNFKEAYRRMVSARKKLNTIEKILRKETV